MWGGFFWGWPVWGDAHDTSSNVPEPEVVVLVPTGRQWRVKPRASAYQAGTRRTSWRAKVRDTDWET